MGKSSDRFGVFLLRSAALVAALGAAPQAGAQTTERVVVDRNSGLAIHGFDPVGYFTDAKPMLGSSVLEYPFAGAVWRFRNEGNRAAFADRPEVYMPRFGGYDPVALALGIATPGHPQLWLVTAARLYLFHSVESRDRFLADPENAVAAAEEKWPSVMHELINEDLRCSGPIARRRIRIAPCDEGERAEALVGSAVTQGGAVRLKHDAAGGDENGVSRGDIPLHRRDQSRIDVGGPFGEAAELHR